MTACAAQCCSSVLGIRFVCYCTLYCSAWRRWKRRSSPKQPRTRSPMRVRVNESATSKCGTDFSDVVPRRHCVRAERRACRTPVGANVDCGCLPHYEYSTDLSFRQAAAAVDANTEVVRLMFRLPHGTQVPAGREGPEGMPLPRRAPVFAVRSIARQCKARAAAHTIEHCTALRCAQVC